jgi:hypothetical protein
VGLRPSVEVVHVEEEVERRSTPPNADLALAQHRGARGLIEGDHGLEAAGDDVDLGRRDEDLTSRSMVARGSAVQ